MSKAFTSGKIASCFLINCLFKFCLLTDVSINLALIFVPEFLLMLFAIWLGFSISGFLSKNSFTRTSFCFWIFASVPGIDLTTLSTFNSPRSNKVLYALVQASSPPLPWSLILIKPSASRASVTSLELNPVFKSSIDLSFAFGKNLNNSAPFVGRPKILLIINWPFDTLISAPDFLTKSFTMSSKKTALGWSGLGFWEILSWI